MIDTRKIADLRLLLIRARVSQGPNAKLRQEGEAVRLFSCCALLLACSSWQVEPKSLLADFVSGGATVFTLVLTAVVFKNHYWGRT